MADNDTDVGAFCAGLILGIAMSLLAMVTCAYPSSRHYREVCALQFQLARTAAESLAVVRREPQCQKNIPLPESP